MSISSSALRKLCFGLLFSLILTKIIAEPTLGKAQQPVQPQHTLFEPFQSINYADTNDNIIRMEYADSSWHSKQLIEDGSAAGNPVPFDNGSPHIVYRDQNGHLQLLYQTGIDWNQRQLTQWESQKAASDPFIYEFKSIHIIYQGLDGQLHEILLDGAETDYYRLTDGEGQKLAGPPIGFVREETQNIVYRLQTGHLMWMQWSGETWVRTQVTDDTDSLAAGDPQLNLFGTQHIVYRGVDDHLHEMVVTQSGWSNYQLTQNDDEKATSDSIGFATDMDGFNQVLVYRGTSGEINTVAYDRTNGKWSHAIIDTSLAPLAAEDTHFSTYFLGAQHLLYKNEQNELSELVLTESGWEHFTPPLFNDLKLKGTPAGFAHIATYPLPPPASLKALAAANNLEFGPAVNMSPFETDAVYKEMLVEEFNMISTENVFKFGPIHPEPDRYFFDDADTLVNFADENDLIMRAHTLVWHTAQPGWLKYGEWNQEELTEILEEHIATVMGRYKGQIKYWDVANEVIDEDTNTYRDTFWYQTIGPEYIDIAFHAARKADPDAILIYNDYGNSHINPKSDAIYEMISGMVDRDVPIDGVAFQLHISTHLPFDIESIRDNMDRFAALGLKVQFSEIDVRIWRNTRALPNRHVIQAKRYQDLMELCLEHPACDTYQTWGITDKHSWVYEFFGGDYPQEAPLPWDVNYEPKLAYYALVNALSGGDWDLIQETATPTPTESPQPTATSTPVETATPLPTAAATATPPPNETIAPTPSKTSTPAPTEPGSPWATSTPIGAGNPFETSTPIPTTGTPDTSEPAVTFFIHLPQINN